MDISWSSRRLLSDSSFIRDLPAEVAGSLREGTNAQYLDTLASLALEPDRTVSIFASHEPVSVEICSKWLASTKMDGWAPIAALSRVLPSLPHLSQYVTAIFQTHQGDILGALRSRKATALQVLPTKSLQVLLLTIFRLLNFDNEAFGGWVCSAQLQTLLKHDSLHIRYMALRILCSYLHCSDAVLESTVKTYIGEGEIIGGWGQKTIDYTFFSLWEASEMKETTRTFECTRASHRVEYSNVQPSSNVRKILTNEFSNTTARIAGVLIPRVDGLLSNKSSNIVTDTVCKNMTSLGEAINTTQPILVTGFSGAGKTSIITEVAQILGKDESLITLHLNEQSDAKLLIGMYASADLPGSFSWRPGVLTTAVKNGKWVLIEDLDRAPAEVVSILLPLIERRQLFVSHLGETINAAPSFKLLATVRSTANTRGESINPATNIMGSRHWLQVAFQMPSNEEFGHIITQKFPILHAYVPQLMAVYSTLKDQRDKQTSSSLEHSGPSRSCGPRDLFRWSARMHTLLSKAGVISGHEPLAENIYNHIFLEAVDCFVGDVAPGSQKAYLVELIARGLDVPSQRVRHCLEVRQPSYTHSDAFLGIGRASLRKRSSISHPRPRPLRPGHNKFTRTNSVLRTLESVGMMVQQSEPCLLVGETGTGKTTIVQQMAADLNINLVVINLSQQTEVQDLIGGFKPVNTRMLAVLMNETFDHLLQLTPQPHQNQHYLDKLDQSISKGRWHRALELWQDALRKIDDKLTNLMNYSVRTSNGQQFKRRKTHTKYDKLKAELAKFANHVHIFQTHLSRGSKGNAFSFCESSIVKAARNGDWVLLDEINLASADTLESVADLLSNGHEGGPSLLLSESGDAERIYAHKDFRIFGAMNPATDIGKRNLPPSLRSRFTELFIEAADKDFENLNAVVKTYLGDYILTDVRASADIARLYLKIKELVSGNFLVDGAGQKSHFSLRSLTRTMVYVTDIAPMYGLRRALFEGFSMAFMTSLNKESQSLLQPLIDQHILGSQKNSKALLNQTPRIPRDGKNYVQFKNYWMAQGSDPTEEQKHYVITPFIEANLLNLVRATSTRRFPVLLQGPTASGKTSMIEYLARISGNKFVRINNHEHTDLQEYLGSYASGPDGRLQYQDGILVKALRHGHWIVLDELNLAPTDVLEALNRLLDDNRELFIPETQQTIRPHENFMLFATQNPPGAYGGRKAFSRAFRNRFLELHFDDIPEAELETILRERSQIAPSFCSKIVDVYKRLSVLRQSARIFEKRYSFATLRDLFRWALRDADDREQLAINGFLLLAERVRNDEERLAVKRTLEEVMKVKLNEDQIYSAASLQAWLGSPLPSPQGIIWTKSARRVYLLVAEALKRNEPVLLVGETGTGKTMICQAIAQLSGTQLYSVNAHQNLETSDLIGAQRPIRNRNLTQARLIADLMTVLKDCCAYKDEYGTDIDLLVSAYEILRGLGSPQLTDEIRYRIDADIRNTKVLFEWSDGSLVQSMKLGHHFLLDEISLADDSVLERLNSVLESDRSLLLAEKGSDDAFVTAASGFQFLATMNPGGDYGKRELSPALRNRMTEIWVPDISEEDDLVDIVRHRLPGLLMGLARPMVKFAAWYATTYSSALSSISIRDLLGWAEFISSLHPEGSSLAVSHGATMVYLDRLGANPSAKFLIPNRQVSQEKLACYAKLEELFGIQRLGSNDEIPRILIDAGLLKVGPFALDRGTDIVESLQYNLHAPTTSLNALKVIRALQLQKPLLLEGPPGVGKTTLIAALANVVGVPLTRINLSDQTDLMDLFGSDVPLEGAKAGRFTWQDAPFLRAMQKGEWVLLDEMNLASQTVLEGLNACLDHRGEVYVSELDQTFSKHPKFRIFAAQNPHSQGGGRKGLPASFVNRFTTVYTDLFAAADLLTICSQRFPDCPSDLIETLVRCVTELSRLVQKVERSGLSGGPWEINLRDILRWLHLLTSQNGSLTAATAAAYKDMLFLHRFRTAEDVTTVANLMNQQLVDNESSHSYFHGRSSTSVEIGLAVLQRNSLLHSPTHKDNKECQTSVPIAESVLLCVQNSWPCLLVGQSGSGKTSLVVGLATSVGADVVQISINHDMDTADLVGAYEQVDVTRDISSFLERLKEHARKILIQRLTSDSKIDSHLADFVFHLASATDLSESSQIIKYLADDDSALQDFQLFKECRNLIERSNTDGRGRFEWVDGMIVRAMKEGKWLILDNANLCNPSVLDRLNSLLEPDGVLSINEHRNADGSARVVKPHRNFRLFLTIDPRHGELSRAMRNRSVELFMHPRCLSVDFSVLFPSVEPNVSRFQMFQAFDWNRLDNIHPIKLMSICFDHLAFSDLRLLKQIKAQVRNGLIGAACARSDLFVSVADLYQRLLEFKGMIFKKTQSACTLTTKQMDSSLDLGTMQTIHPLNNPSLCSLISRSFSLESFQHLGQSFDLSMKIYEFGQKLDLAARMAQQKRLPDMTRLERSFMSFDFRRIHNDSTQPVAAFLQDVVVCLQGFIEQESPSEAQTSMNALHLATDLIHYIHDIFDLTQSTEFDEHTFQAYHAIGRNLLPPASTRITLPHSKTRIAVELALKLDKFNSSLQLHTGIGMESLWSTIKPFTARDSTRLELILQCEELAERFDAFKWQSEASLQELQDGASLLVGVHDVVSSQGMAGSILLQEAKEALDALEIRSTSSRERGCPYFQQQFVGFSQIDGYTRRSISAPSNPQLDLLAGKRTKNLMDSKNDSRSWRLLSQLQRETAIGNRSMELAATRQILPISTLSRLMYITDVPLNSMTLVTNEIDTLAAAVAASSGLFHAHPLQNLASLLKSLQTTFSQSLSLQVDLRQQDVILKNFEMLPSWSRGVSAPSNLLDKRTEFEVDQSRHLKDCVQSVIKESLLIPHISSDHGRDYTRHMAHAYIQFFTGCLLLYVPDRPFDPALKPRVERDRHNKRRAELQQQLQALQQFEKVFSGQTSSYRIHLIEQSLLALGAEPQVPAIFRPPMSELGGLQGEFNTILKSIVLQSPNESTLEAVFGGDIEKIQSIESRRQDIETTISRLLGQFRAYDDITKPLVALLQGLDIGLALSLIANPQPSASDTAIEALCAMIPFFGARPQDLVDTSYAWLQERRHPQFDPRLLFIRISAITKALNTNDADRMVQIVLEIFHNYYREWKEHLDHDQQVNASKSSIYHYRGSHNEDDEADGKEFEDLFPSYEGSKGTDDHNKNDPGRVAQQLADLHRQTFDCTAQTSPQLLDTIETASAELASLWHSRSDTTLSGISADKTLSALILSLDRNKECLYAKSRNVDKYNFYTDENLPEARRLVLLVTKIHARYSDLHKTWPEHATLINTLQTCIELLAMRHKEPLAKMITKAEQLHGYLHEWQVVTSREYSTTSFYDQLTELLVSWRRLELSTWARMLDMENEKCAKDADCWWFIAYEVIIAAPLSMIDSEELLRSHSEQLFSTLERFVTTTSMGQYTQRLHMLRIFERHLLVLTKEQPFLGIIRHTLTNFLRYYSRFESAISQKLYDGRLAIEKDMKEVLLLASWKDTNIIALRDSARRSHHKLFKIIRKYRDVLAQTAGTIVLQAIPERSYSTEECAYSLTPMKLTNPGERVVDACRKHLESWHMKPPRFKNPVATAENMSRNSQVPPTCLQPALYLENYADELIDHIRILQKETPSVADQENDDTIKNLRARKRKLFSKTLKDVRRMGFKSNLSADARAKQASTAIVLSNCPALSGIDASIELLEAEQYFHQLLNLMPMVKERTRNRSKDLDSGEVTRSIGYIESIISTVIKQRHALATSTTDIGNLVNTYEMVKNVWAPDEYRIQVQDDGEAVPPCVLDRIRWLPTIIKAACKIIEAFERITSTNQKQILDDLRRYEENFAALVRVIDGLPLLPPGMSSTSRRDKLDAVESQVKGLQAHLQTWMREHSHLNFVLKQIGLWAEGTAVSHPAFMREKQVVALDHFDAEVCTVLDSVLVTIQRVQEALKSLPSSDEDASWLTMANTSLDNISHCLHANEVNKKLQNILRSMQGIENKDLESAGAICALATPIIQQYINIVSLALKRREMLHKSLCRLGLVLTRSFSQIVQEGFCNPPEKSAADQGKTEKLEGGTGLGEGEGAEDISKDIQDDEDLSELAHQPGNDKDRGEIEDQEDAVDMDHDELEGEMGDVPDKGQDSGSEDEQTEQDIEDETGAVDDLDPSAVDEKVWDGQDNETEKKKEGSKQKGKTEREKQAAADGDIAGEKSEGAEEDEENHLEGADEEEHVACEEPQKMDPKTSEGQNLDLPEEIDMINEDDASSELESEDDSSDLSFEQPHDAGDDTMQAEENEGGELAEEDLEEDPAAFSDDQDSKQDDKDPDNIQEDDSLVDTDPEGNESTEGVERFDYRDENTARGQETATANDQSGDGDDVKHEDAQNEQSERNAQGTQGLQGNQADFDDAGATSEGQANGNKRSGKGAAAENDETSESNETQSFKKLGDALERWHRQHKEIKDAVEQEGDFGSTSMDADKADQEFEHLQGDEDEADTQALGAATEEQARALDKRALESQMTQNSQPLSPETTEELRNGDVKDEDDIMRDFHEDTREYDEAQKQRESSALIANRRRLHSPSEDPDSRMVEHEEDIDDLENGLSVTHIQPTKDAPSLGAEEAGRLWCQYEVANRELSLSLTEQLRLILAPTQATKMRGDFRTGKRLNIKRIIPYIASEYKRDKIWMRRSVPSKRNYQIMLAVDDSKSMGESGSGQLAFETLAMIAKSLSMLEVGEICVVGFGNEVFVAHEFDKPFSSEAGTHIFQQFSFQQTRTDVQKLVAESTALFSEARQKTFNAGVDLWQLELIISDGVCEDHPRIRRLVRQAQEQRIMVVFVIVDVLLKGGSILDMNQAVFEPDASGETKLQMKRYLDGFPFPYYVVVGNVHELPGVLAQALRQWFTEVAESE